MSDDSVLLRLATGFGGLSLFAVGGALSMLPDLHLLVVERWGLLSDAEFARTFAISQIAPGPNMMVVSLLGWRLAGLAGLLVATLATIGPSAVVAFFVGRGFTRLSAAPWFPAVKLGLAPVVVGIYLAAGLVAARTADSGPFALFITVAVAAWVTLARQNPLWGLGAGAVCGALGAALGWM